MPTIPSGRSLFSVKSLGFCALFSLFTFCCERLPAATITPLCNTGTQVSGSSCSAVLNGGASDASYMLTVNPNIPGGSNSYVVVADPSGYPLNSWIANSAISEWIGPAMADQPCCGLGDYTYDQSFTVSGGAETISGRWAADNEATMYVNGVEVAVGGTTATFQQWTPFSFSVSTPGTQTFDLTFVVDNYGEASGLRVEFNSAPEPSTFAALGAGLVMIGFIKRKRVGRMAVD